MRNDGGGAWRTTLPYLWETDQRSVWRIKRRTTQTGRSARWSSPRVVYVRWEFLEIVLKWWSSGFRSRWIPWNRLLALIGSSRSIEFAIGELFEVHRVSRPFEIARWMSHQIEFALNEPFVRNRLPNESSVWNRSPNEPFDRNCLTRTTGYLNHRLI